MSATPDAVIVGAGPNGLAAGIVLAQAGKRVRIYEANDDIGGGARSGSLTLEGFTHDLCSAVHPLAAASPFFTSLPLARFGLEFIYPPAALAHPFDDGTAVLLYRSVETTSQQLRSDEAAYRKLMGPIVQSWPNISEDLLGPLRLPRHPFALARFGLRAIRSAEGLICSHFKEQKTRAFFAGLSAHSSISLDHFGTAAFGLVLGATGHCVGWPIPRGGARAVSNALAAYFAELGGEIVTGKRVDSMKDIPAVGATLFDVTPRQLLVITGESFPSRFKRKLQQFRYGPSVFKMDWALSGPVPWQAPACDQAATIHLGGSFQEILESERDAWEGRTNARPFIIACQPSLFDSTRAPAGQHTLWAYCHVPNGSSTDMVPSIEDQIERFAPGFRKLVLGRNVMFPASLEKHNANLVGGDISGGAHTLAQLFTRPTLRTYSTPVRGIYICSSSTPPGAGVHGMCGYHAARVALRKSFDF
jgi:phytoene dehydrogenase-like protein